MFKTRETHDERKRGGNAWSRCSIVIKAEFDVPVQDAAGYLLTITVLYHTKNLLQFINKLIFIKNDTAVLIYKLTNIKTEFLIFGWVFQMIIVAITAPSEHKSFSDWKPSCQLAGNQWCHHNQTPLCVLINICRMVFYLKNFFWSSVGSFRSYLLLKADIWPWVLFFLFTWFPSGDTVQWAQKRFE